MQTFPRLNMARRFQRLHSPWGMGSMVMGTVAAAMMGVHMEQIVYGGVVGAGTVLFGDLVVKGIMKANPLQIAMAQHTQALLNGPTQDDLDSVILQQQVVESVVEKQTPYGRGGDTIVDLAPNCKPRLNDILGRGILGVGMRGSGKSYFAARLIEEVGKFPIAMAIFDYKRDYITLPTILDNCVIAGHPDWADPRRGDHYWDVTTENAAAAGQHLLENGLQVVLQMQSYDSMAEAAEVMVVMLEGMLSWAVKQTHRVPCLAVLDEAQQFLPQNMGDANTKLTKEVASRCFNVWEKINAVGRSLGFTPAIFTQRIAQINNAVIAGSDIFFLMKQTLPADLEVYERIVGKDENGKQRIDRRMIQEMKPGTGLIFEGGDLLLTHFSPRRSEHLSTTPGLEDAITFYSGKHLTKSLGSLPVGPKKDSVAHESDSFRAAYKELTGEELDVDEEEEDGPDTIGGDWSQYETHRYAEHENDGVYALGDEGAGPFFAHSERGLNAPEISVPVVESTGPDLGDDDRRFTSEQAQEFLRRYHKEPMAIKQILRQMNNGLGLSNRYCKHAAWLIKQEQQ